MLRIRLARFGRRNLPYYRIFVADSRSKRDGKHVANVGYYDPLPARDGNKHIGLHFDKIKYYLAVGAQPSERVAWLLSRVGLIPPPPKFKKPRLEPEAGKAASQDS